MPVQAGERAAAIGGHGHAMMASKTGAAALEEAAAASFPERPDLSAMPEALYRQRLGLPADARLEPALVSLAGQAREWFSNHGKPWSGATVYAVESVEGSRVSLEKGTSLHSEILARGLRVTKTRSLVVVGFSAGQAVDEEIERLWAANRPDEAQFLDSYAIAVVEHLRQAGWQTLNELTGHAVLPHFSPGYEGWPLEEQRVLFHLLRDHGPMRLLESFMLAPAKSMLAVYGIACPKTEHVCQDFWERFAVLAQPVSPAGYSFSAKVLRRWSRHRLSMTTLPDGTIKGVFRIDGSTCANMGLPLALDYEVKLTRGEEGDYIIAGCRCSPAGGDRGHRSTCLHLSDPEGFHRGAAEKPPLIGQALGKALSWKPELSPAGCLCTRASRDHKWSVVLQTLHFALNQDEP